MPPTTLKLSEELKDRIRAIVTDTGESMHSFMLKAIERETRLAEHRKSFVADALEGRADFERTGTGYDAHEVHEYFRAPTASKRPSRPKAKRWRGASTPRAPFPISPH